jgi:hypothetical protein
METKVATVDGWITHFNIGNHIQKKKKVTILTQEDKEVAKKVALKE